MSELFRKWFGLEPVSCGTCEVLANQLAASERERRELLQKLLEKDKPEPRLENEEKELKPITPAFIPWRQRQQMLEAEDRKQAQLLKDRTEEIEKLEKEVGVK